MCVPALILIEDPFMIDKVYPDLSGSMNDPVPVHHQADM